MRQHSWPWCGALLAATALFAASCQTPQQDQQSASVVPYEGALPPGDPPRTPLPPTQRPLEPWVHAALDAHYERPAPRGREPIPLRPAKAIYVEGRSPVIQAMPGPAVFNDRVPQHLQTAMPREGPYSNAVRRLPRGTIRLAAVDSTLNDTRISVDRANYSAAIAAVTLWAEGTFVARSISSAVRRRRDAHRGGLPELPL